MTLILSLLLFNVGFVLGGWWAAHVARQKSEGASGARRLRGSAPRSRNAAHPTLEAYDPVVSQN